MAILARHADAARFAYNRCLAIVKSALDRQARDATVVVPRRLRSDQCVQGWKRSPAAGRVLAVDSVGVVQGAAVGLVWRDLVCQQVFEEAAVDLSRALAAFDASRRGEQEKEYLQVTEPAPGEERVVWQFVPMISVGPLEFGGSPNEVAEALGSKPYYSTSDMEYREERFYEQGVHAYYDTVDHRLTCIVVDAHKGPQVRFDEVSLVGQVPSTLAEWAYQYANRQGIEYKYGDAGDPELPALGLVLRVQRNRDHLISRPIFLGRSADLSWELVPLPERRTFWQ